MLWILSRWAHICVPCTIFVWVVVPWSVAPTYGEEAPTAYVEGPSDESAARSTMVTATGTVSALRRGPVAVHLAAFAPTAAQRRAQLRPFVAGDARPRQNGFVRDIPTPRLLGVMIEPRGRGENHPIGPSLVRRQLQGGVQILTSVVVDSAD